MAHNHVYGVCENKCFVEVSPKAQTDEAFRTLNSELNKIKTNYETINEDTAFGAGVVLYNNTKNGNVNIFQNMLVVPETTIKKVFRITTSTGSTLKVVQWTSTGAQTIATLSANSWVLIEELYR